MTAWFSPLRDRAWPDGAPAVNLEMKYDQIQSNTKARNKEIICFMSYNIGTKFIHRHLESLLPYQLFLRRYFSSNSEKDSMMTRCAFFLAYFFWICRFSNIGHKRPKLMKNSELQACRVDTSMGQCEARVYT